MGSVVCIEEEDRFYLLHDGKCCEVFKYDSRLIIHSIESWMLNLDEHRNFDVDVLSVIFGKGFCHVAYTHDGKLEMYKSGIQMVALTNFLSAVHPCFIKTLNGEQSGIAYTRLLLVFKQGISENFMKKVFCV